MKRFCCCPVLVRGLSLVLLLLLACALLSHYGANSVLSSVLPTRAINASLGFFADPLPAVFALHVALHDVVLRHGAVDSCHNKKRDCDSNEVEALVEEDSIGHDDLGACEHGHAMRLTGLERRAYRTIVHSLLHGVVVIPHVILAAAAQHGKDFVQVLADEREERDGREDDAADKGLNDRLEGCRDSSLTQRGTRRWKGSAKAYMRPTATSRTLSRRAKSVKPSHSCLARVRKSPSARSKASWPSSRRGMVMKGLRGLLWIWDTDREVLLSLDEQDAGQG